MGEWLTRVLTYAEPAWTWLAALLAVPVVVPLARVIHKFWVRPIIQVRLDDQVDCHGRTPLVSLKDGKVVAQVMYLRLRIQNRGRTTIKDCLGNWVRIRVWSAGKIFDFAHEVISRGWAHHPESKQRNIPRGEAYYLDVATLLLSEDQKHNTLWWPDPIPPTNMMEFLHSLPPGKATYLFEIRVNADNARPRTVPVQFVFDPARSKLSFIPFNTRYPGWRWRWWWRARRDR